MRRRCWALAGSDLGGSRAPDGDTVFEIGSITKTFTGILLARRVERGELELDDRVGDFLPEGWTLSDEAGDVTLEHLTTHTSGIPRLPANLLGVGNIFGQAFGGDPYRNYSEEDFRAALADVELNFEPGASREYSNFAVGLLGFLLATHNGTDYETLLKSEILKPLGMTRTTITNDAWHDEHVAPGYRGADSRAGQFCDGLVTVEYAGPPGRLRRHSFDRRRHAAVSQGEYGTASVAARRGNSTVARGAVRGVSMAIDGDELDSIEGRFHRADGHLAQRRHGRLPELSWLYGGRPDSAWWCCRTLPTTSTTSDKRS